jgi:hypothetical protein
MMRRIVGLLFVIILSTVGVIDALAYRYYWYWRHWWLDMLMHSLAGFGVGLFVLFIWRGIWEKIEAGLPRRRWATPLATACLGLILGLVWELYELAILMYIGGYRLEALSPILNMRRLDTLSDLYFDTMGGLVAGLLTERLSQWQRK